MRRLQTAQFVGGIALAVALLALALQRGCSEFVRWRALNGIPENVVVEELLLEDSQPDLRETCGVAIFRLSRVTAEQIDRQGLNFFSSSRTGRDGGKYYRYDTWSQTPSATPGARVLRGLGCAKVDERLAKALRDAAESPGSYIGLGYEYDLLVIPKLGLVVHSFDG